MNIADTLAAALESSPISQLPLHHQLVSAARRESDPDLVHMLLAMARLVDGRTPCPQQSAAVTEVLNTVSTLAFRDELTGLLNRAGFMRNARRLLNHAQLASQRAILLYMDVNNLKRVNDTAGHRAGDRLLNGVAKVLRLTFRDGDVVGRLGGDEFASLTLSNNGEDDRSIERRLNHALRQINLPSERFPVCLSVGLVSCDPNSPASLDDLIDQADSFMYSMKRSCQDHPAETPPARYHAARATPENHSPDLLQLLRRGATGAAPAAAAATRQP